MNEEKKNKISGWDWILIPLDFILFYFTFFEISYWDNLNDNKGIPFTLLLFITFILVYKFYIKKKNEEKKEIESKETISKKIEELSEKCDEISSKIENISKE